MKAIMHQNDSGLNGVKYSDLERPTVQDDQVLIKVKAAGLNRRDLIVCVRHSQDDPPLILGSDGAGVIEDVGADVTQFSSGDEVIINPALGWFEKSDAPPKNFQILSLPDHGTFAQYIVISAEQVERKPKHLSWEEAGVLPLSALTAYRVLFTRGQVKAGDTVLIPGIGSGVATYLLQFAKKAGARVIVTSRSEEKLEKARQLGADVAINTSSDWTEVLNGEKVDLVIESIGRATFEKSLQQLRPGGTVVTFGATTDDEVTFNIRDFFYGQFNLLGSTMGSREEFREMIDFIEKHEIKPVIDRVYPLSDGKKALERLKDSENFGKIALTIEV
jgi:zinc-binding alcohol dehydrogenase/oxidoreductase